MTPNVILISGQWRMVFTKDLKIYCENLCIAQTYEDFVSLFQEISRQLVFPPHGGCGHLSIRDARTGHKVIIQRSELAQIWDFLSKAEEHHRLICELSYHHVETVPIPKSRVTEGVLEDCSMSMN